MVTSFKRGDKEGYVEVRMPLEDIEAGERIASSNGPHRLQLAPRLLSAYG